MAGRGSFFPNNSSDDYPRVQTSAHFSQPPRLRPPAVYSHVAFWNPVEIRADDTVAEARQRRKLAADKYTAAIWHNLKNCEKIERSGVSDTRSPNRFNTTLRLFAHYIKLNDVSSTLIPYDIIDPEFNVGRQEVEFTFNWFGLRVTIHCEQRTEYFTSTFIIDLSSVLSEDIHEKIIRDKNILTTKLVGAFSLLDKLVFDRSYFPSEKYVGVFKQLYIECWDQFYQEILADASGFESDLGDIFADFRCLLLGTPIPPHRTIGRAFQQPFWRKAKEETSLSEMIYRRGFPFKEKGEKDWAGVLDAFWSFLTVNVGGVNFSSHEFTATSMMNGDALYATALGVQPNEASSTDRGPLYGFLVTRNYSGWHIGRLVQQLNYLGSTRLAAMYYFGKFRNSAYKLREVSHRIAEARRVYIDDQSKYKDLLEKGEGHWKDRLAALSLSIRSVNELFSGIDEGFGSSFGYRLDRARYYIGEFYSGLAALEITALRGFQAYDVFIRRRLGSSFNSIESFHDQHASVVADIRSLTALEQNERAQLVEVETRNRSTRLEELGSVADAALWGGLLPYYAGSVLLHYILDGESFDKIINAALWILTWDLFASIGVYLHIKKLAQKSGADKVKKRRNNLLFSLLGINVMISCLVLVWPERQPEKVTLVGNATTLSSGADKLLVLKFPKVK